MEKDLGYRKVQCTGRGSYIISLPKDWVQETGIEKGSEVLFKVNEDSSLTLVPRKIMEGKREPKKPKLKEYWIHVDAKDNPQSVCRKIISLYVVSADIIHIRFKHEEIASKFKKAINNLVKNMLLGSEIIEETTKGITIKILIRHPDFSVERAIRRMAVLALSASRVAVSALRSMDQEFVREVIETCGDVNRLNLYVTRQLKYGLERNLFKELGFKTPKEFLGYRIVANDIKSIADNATHIALNVAAFKKMIETEMLFLKEAIDEEAYSQISEFNSSAHQLFEESLTAMFKRDYDHADRIISKVESFATRENDLFAVISGKKLDPNISSIFSLILDNSKRIIEYSQNIAEVTLNRTIEEVSSQNF